MTTLVSLEQRFGPVAAIVQSFTSMLFTLPVRVFAQWLRRVKGRPPMAKDFDPRTIRSILLTRLDGLGDMVLFSSFVREVRMLWPEAHITLVVDDRFVSLVEHCPHVDEVIGFDERGSKYNRLFTGPRRAYALARKRLFDRHIDLAISPRWDFDTRHAAVLNFISLPRHHFGFSERVSPRKRALNFGLDSLFTHVVPSRPGVYHEADRNAEMLTALGGNPARIRDLEIWLSADDQAYAEESLSRSGLGDEPLICLGIGATQAKRCWPIDRFAGLAQWLVEQHGARILIVGDTADAHKAELLRPVLGSALINQAGICNVRQSAALVARCSVFIGNDSGPMHLAAASRLLVIALSCHPITGPQDHINSPYRYAPLSKRARVMQPHAFSKKCHAGCNQSDAHCILNLHVHDVQQLLDEVMTARSLTSSAFATAGVS